MKQILSHRPNWFLDIRRIISPALAVVFQLSVCRRTMRFNSTLSMLAILAFSSLSIAFAHDGHVHATHDVAPESAPRIDSFTVEKATEGGFVVTLKIANFTFVEDGTTAAPNGHSGHAHLYINGHELGMWYTPKFVIEELPFGPHDLKVVLSAPDHSDYAVNGCPIETTTTITVE